MINLKLVLLACIVHRQLRPKLTFKDGLSISAARRRDRRVTRRALPSPSMAPFHVLLMSTCDQSLITVTGVDHATFVYLLNKFSPLYDRYTPYSTSGGMKLLRTEMGEKRLGRPRSLNATMCLGLLLAWHRSRGSMFSLCMLFGCTASVCSLFIRFARRLFVVMLKDDDDAKIRMPSNAEFETFKQAIGSKYHQLSDVYCTADGLKLYLEQSGDAIVQNMFYNGWKADHYVTNVFVFSPMGTVIACAYNCPGSFHDSTVAEWGGVYDKLEDMFARTGGKCVVDSAFSRGMHPFLIKSAQDETEAEGPSEIVKIRQATSLRQASEWGMRAFQGSFPRIKDRFIYEETGERKVMLLCLMMLFNIRARRVGVNQILSVYMPHLSVEVDMFLHEQLHIFS